MIPEDEQYEINLQEYQKCLTRNAPVNAKNRAMEEIENDRSRKEQIVKTARSGFLRISAARFSRLLRMGEERALLLYCAELRAIQQPSGANIDHRLASILGAIEDAENGQEPEYY